MSGLEHIPILLSLLWGAKYVIKSPMTNYYIKLMTIYAGFLNMGVWLSIYGIFHKTFETSRFAKKLLDPIGKVLGIHFIVHGSENINRKQPYIIICNHQHALDIITGMQIWDMFEKAAVAAKKPLKWMGPFGIALQMTGAIFIERNNLANTRAVLDQAVKRAKENNTSILLFPEGTRHLKSTDGISMLPFKKGAFHMALNAGLPILPVVISEYDFIDSKRKIFGKTTREKLSANADKEKLVVTINVLQPIETNELSLESIDKLIDHTRNKMLSVFETSS